MRFGLVGSGRAGPLFGGALAARPGGASLVGVATSRHDTARAAAQRWGAETAFATWQDLVAAPDIEAVCVATPTGTHEEITVAALDAGKHVLVEKPIATCLAEADRMIEAAERNRRVLGVIFMYRLMDTALLLKRAVSEGHLGRILYAEVGGHFWRDQAYYDSGEWRGTWSGEGGGSLMSQTSHTLDLLLWMLGPVRSVSGTFSRTPAHTIETEDLVTATVRFEDGALATVLSTTASPSPSPRTLMIAGERGVVELVGDELGRFEVPTLEDEATVLRSSAVADRGDTAAAASFSDSELHRRQIEDFVLAAADGRRPSVDGVEGRQTLEVMRAIYRSAVEDRVVHLPLGNDETSDPSLMAAGTTR